MRKIIFFLAILSLLVFNGTGVLATEESSNSVMPREGILQRIRERNQIRIEEMQKNREELKKLMEQKQLEFRNRLQEKRGEAISQFEEKKAQLRERLRIIKDERKQRTVERIYDQIQRINERMRDHYLFVLEKLEKVLERIESRTAKAMLEGKDVSSVEAKINLAKDLIEKAREAVKNQASRVYEPPQITNEKNLKTDVGKIRQEIHKDLKAVEALVKEARTAVREAAVQLAQLIGENWPVVPSPANE